MNFLGMGPGELTLILIIALVVFGPGKLPEIAGQVGRVIRDVRRATTDLSSEFHRTLSLEIEEKQRAEAGTVDETPSQEPEAVAAEPTVEAVPEVAAAAPADEWQWEESPAATAAVGAPAQQPATPNGESWEWSGADGAEKPTADVKSPSAGSA
ncbi:MAG: twin-arginine translocase TatA/TatE family subunit [Chloroflexota bacterium]